MNPSNPFDAISEKFHRLNAMMILVNSGQAATLRLIEELAEKTGVALPNGETIRAAYDRLCLELNEKQLIQLENVDPSVAAHLQQLLDDSKPK